MDYNWLAFRQFAPNPTQASGLYDFARQARRLESREKIVFARVPVQLRGIVAELYGRGGADSDDDDNDETNDHRPDEAEIGEADEDHRPDEAEVGEAKTREADEIEESEDEGEIQERPDNAVDVNVEVEHIAGQLEPIEVERLKKESYQKAFNQLKSKSQYPDAVRLYITTRLGLAPTGYKQPERLSMIAERGWLSPKRPRGRPSTKSAPADATKSADT